MSYKPEGFGFSGSLLFQGFHLILQSSFRDLVVATALDQTSGFHCFCLSMKTLLGVQILMPSLQQVTRFTKPVFYYDSGEAITSPSAQQSMLSCLLCITPCHKIPSLVQHQTLNNIQQPHIFIDSSRRRTLLNAELSQTSAVPIKY